MSTRELSTGQTAILGTTAALMTVVGGVGAWGTYTNAITVFHRQATAGGVVAAGEGLTLVLALVMLSRTMLGQAAPAVVRAGMWVAPVSASFIGLSIADTPREAVVYAVTPLAMSGSAEALGLIARSIVIYRTGRDAEADRRNAATVQQLAYQQAVAAGHPDKDRQEAATRRAWRLVGQVGVGDPQLAEGLVDVSRTKLTAGAGHALDRMLALPQGDGPAAPPAPRSASATDAIREHFATLDPVEAIRVAAAARPDAGPVELADILGAYGVSVDPVAVALVLSEEPSQYTVDRPDAAVAPQVRELAALNLQGAIEEAATALGDDASPRDIAGHLEQHRRLIVPENHIRSALSRAAKKTETDQPATPRNTDMEGGYA